MNLTDKQKEIIRKIIYAVETGGQVYGQARYDAFTPAGTNTSNERAITIGAGQWYANEAKKLLDRIRKEYADTFNKLDTQGIGYDIDNRDWSIYTIGRNSDKAKCIVSIIDSAGGHKVQDAMIDEQMQQYVDEAYALGVRDVDALFMCANFRHHGGYGAVTRILKKTTKPYSLDNLYQATLTDTGNQVGAYRTRQKKVYEWLKKYVSAEEVTTMVSVDSILTIARGWIGYSEANGKWWEIVNGVYNNYIKSHSGAGRGYVLNVFDAWCDAFVSSLFIKAGAVDAIGAVECGCPNHIDVFKKCGLWKGLVKPVAGDIVLFDWQNGRSEWGSDHIGIVEKVEGDYITTIEGNYNDTVGRRTIKYNATAIVGYARPKYSKSSTSVSTNTTNTDVKPVSTSGGASIKATSKINFAVSKKPSPSMKPYFVGEVTASQLNVRVWANVDSENIKSYPVLAKTNLVDVCDAIQASNGDTWYYIRIAGKIFGFVHSAYIKKV